MSFFHVVSYMIIKVNRLIYGTDHTLAHPEATAGRTYRLGLVINLVLNFSINSIAIEVNLLRLI